MTDISKFFNVFCGRATTFAIFFTLAGTTLAFKGHLDASYVALITAIQGLVFAHSWKEDVMEAKAANLDIQPKGPSSATQSS